MRRLAARDVIVIGLFFEFVVTYCLDILGVWTARPCSNCACGSWGVVSQCNVFSGLFCPVSFIRIIFFFVKLSPSLTLPSVARNMFPWCGAEFHVSVVSRDLPVIVHSVEQTCLAVLLYWFHIQLMLVRYSLTQCVCVCVVSNVV